MSLIRLAIPKGSLQQSTIDLFRDAGWNITTSSRSYFPSIDDPDIECALVRAQEISRYVESGLFDVALTGKDWILENSSDVQEVEDLIYSKATYRPAKWVLAVDEKSDIHSIHDLQGKKIATELVNFTRKYFRERGIDVDVEFSWGATEAKVVDGLADAIVEVTETGSTIRAHNLKIIEELLLTNTKLIANKESWKDSCKRSKIEQIAMMLKSALQATGMAGLKMNAPRKNLEQIIAMLPAITSPTVSPLHDPEWYSLEIIIHESQSRNLIPELLRAGARGIIEYPLKKVLDG
ncbi:MAG: ATP phosphoribosyltransferase [Desulfomonilia bacterium]|jgi:ATP phosphoribosyltransferase|uniref:ATP phosphoribosyltransferase n=1 Tax=anaerobic digester metagenome TaxID=1263854 RepID=A0A485M1E7_9ZZZZ|nr:ATP phosphoribosyltransferase [Pseudomonadota bacterium]HON39019.1 ATP phosphoribosyltransferase [Deltaproteobacteria bacterium]HRS56004.1 ATP phosphoribosyltransferase [Desulfomonilia bacterium]HPD21358.1 ATP phosphoribosyltransferase [Deltaproteobacteria bacterium]HPX19763.1 ATP phosphoribosyltransferase [Deltaproteobacteria bacterium]